MLRRIPRFLRISVLTAVLLAVSVSVFQSWSSASPGMGGWVQTQWGPLGPADRNLLVKVRLAGLWETPTGQQAMQQADTFEVKEVGRIISTEHVALDAKVRATADELGVLLPSSPSPQQVAWMNEISAQTGSDYDRVFIQRLREAHGIVLPVIAEVRATTRNTKIRLFAEVADTFVSGHIDHLEGSGLVDFTALPEAPSPGLLSGEPYTRDLIVPILVFVAAVLGALGLVTALRRRPRRAIDTTPPPRRWVPAASVSTVSMTPPGPIPRPRAVLDSVPYPAADDLPTIAAEIIQDTGSHRLPIRCRSSGEDTGSHRVPAGMAPGETTGPRHSIRR